MPDLRQPGGDTRSNMKVELLHIADCPNREATRRLLEEALREFGLSDRITEVEVSDSMQAERLCFPGSPTIRVDEIDVETPLPRQNGNGLSCRTYLVAGRLQGVPTREMIREGIRSAITIKAKQ
jgi:hypothetical protein